MNPHFHPYQDMHSPHSPVDAFHGHGGHGGPPGPHPGMMSNGAPQDGQVRPVNGDMGTGSPFNNMPGNNGLSHNPMCGGPGGGPPPGGLKICAGCGGKIMERFLLHALDRYWHNACLKCSCCATMLADVGSSCFTKGGMILCKTDYIRMFGNTGACSSCGQTIPANEFVMRAGPSGQTSGPTGGPGGVNQPGHHVYHLKCFVCSKCQSPLIPGDRYALVHGALICEQDCQKLLKGGAGVNAGAATGPVRKGKVGRPRRSRD